VAQSGSAPVLGTGGPEFESRRPDQLQEVFVVRVRILRPSRAAMQSGRGRLKQWLIEPELITPKRPEAMNGWVSAGDTLTSQLKIRFSSREEAETFAQKQGWKVVVDAPNERRVIPQNYGDNFRIQRSS
jgi:ETC complex I subunit conserved region